MSAPAVNQGIPKGRAIQMGADLIALFEGATERMELFGQCLRPNVLRVQSIEIRCVSLIRPEWDSNDNPRGPEINWQVRRLRELIASGVLQHRHKVGADADSPTYQRLRYKGEPVEIFCVKADHWPECEEVFDV